MIRYKNSKAIVLQFTLLSILLSTFILVVKASSPDENIKGTLSPANSFVFLSEKYGLKHNRSNWARLSGFEEKMSEFENLFGLNWRWQDSVSFLVPPSVSSISPSTPQTSITDQNVVVNGSNFVSGLTVTVTFPSGGTTTLSGSQIVNVTSSSFTMRITLAATGTWRIRVNNPNGEQSNIFQFNVVTAQTPSISSISPSSPTINNSDQNVQVNGSNFQNGMTVTVFIPGGGTVTLSGSQIQNITTTSFRMVITLNVVGTYGIRVNNPSGLQSNTFNFQTQAATPSISSISPSGVCAQPGDRNFNVSGSNFQSGLTVTVFIPGGGTVTLSGSQIQNVTSTSFTMIATLNVVGTYNFRVNNPNGTQSANFPYTTQNCNPSISSISPSTPTVSNSDQNVVVNGSNFQSGLTVTIFIPGGGTVTLSGSQIQNVTSTSFTMVVTLNVAGTYGIRVNNPNGLQSNTFNFQTQNPAPGISSINPSSPCVNGNNQNVTVNGTNFLSGLTVTVFIPGGGTVTLSGSQIQNVTSTSFTMIITLNVQGTYGIRVNNPNGVQSNTFNFSTQYCVTISSISPSSPTVGNSDQSIVVNGSGFQTGLTVTVILPNNGGTVTLSGSQIQNVNSTSFTMLITLNVIGTYGIRVNNPNGNQSNIFTFTTQAAAPSISSINPTSPCFNGNDQNVVVNGSNFQSGLTVTVFFPTGGNTTLSGSQIQNVTATSFTMIITLNIPGTYGIRVNNPNGTQSSVFNFSTQYCVTISSISPSSPTVNNADQNVQVNGSGYQPGLTVTVFIPGGSTVTLSGTQIQNVTSTSFTMIITLNVVGTYGIRVNNPNNQQSNTFNFNTQSPAPPTVSSINPSTPTANGNDQNVIVTGTNFQQGLTVTVTFPGGGTGTLSGTQIQNVTSTSFTMRITLGAAGNWNMRVNNPNGAQSNVLPFTVQSNVQAPSIFTINPATPIVRNTDQDVVVSGSNFQQNLTVDITFPAGGGTTLSGAQIQNVTATSFIMRATLNAAGNWTIRVRNSDGGQSSIFGFSVSNGTNPVINSINPATPVTNGADQNVIVSGGNFQPNLRVNVTFPSGGMATLQGTGQIQNVTSNSFLMRITLNAAGSWTIRVVNPDNSQSQQFAFNVQASGPPPTGLPTSVLSPVIGPLRVTTSNQGINDGKWEFNQHATGYHTTTGGISLSNDRYAWDINLYTPTSGNADAGRPVFAVADGQVVSYVGTPPGGGPGAVLIAHPNAQNPVWFSGFLHMTNVRVTLGQAVNSVTQIGEIGRTGVNNDHLHFVVYSGQNSRGNLQSFNASISERLANGTNPPTISGIIPSVVNQSNEPQLITINGANFQANSIIEVQSPNGQYFTVTPETITGLTDESKITNITATSITARVAFNAGGTYEFSIITPPTNLNLSNQTGNSFTVSNSNTVHSVPSGRTPVIFIPGIMGSRIAKRGPNNSFPELWLAWLFNDDEHHELANNVEDPSNYRSIDSRNVVATNIIRNVGIDANITDVYGNLIDYLTNEKQYILYNVDYPTVRPCDTSRTDADLFVFPYDWRNSNWTSARDLWNYVQCIKSIRGNPPNFKVDIIAHSMGGLVARRYILNNPGTHNVDRMVTLGTPWLGAPKVIGIMDNGVYDFWTNRVVNRNVLKQIAPYIKGAHELIPSRAYTDDLTTADYGSFPLGEMGWDFNFDQRDNLRYNFSLLKAAMNVRYSNPLNRPGDTTDIFHSQPGQDQWNANNLFGVNYYQFVGYGKNTIGTIVAKRELGSNFLAIANADGDGTVPLVSATRVGRQNYRGPIQLEKGFPLNHGELASKRMIFPFINCVVNVPNANACINNMSATLGLEENNGLVGEPNYLLKVIGSESVMISDSFGNTTNPLSTSVDEGIRTIETDVTGDKYLSATFPLDQNYKAVIKAPSTPFSIILTKSNGEVITQAIRYLEITLPANVLALLEITPQGVTNLAYDSDGNGTFDTPVNPTIIVTGMQAQDVEPPNVIVNETVQSGTSQIILEATDVGTGVQRIMYSLNGTTYQQYSTPLTLNSAQTPTIYVFADDNVFNRSGLVTHNLTASNTGFGVTGPTTAPGGSQITVNWNAPNGRPVDDWIGLFRVGTLNSAFISKQHTGGLTSGSLNFTLPNQSGTYEFRYLINDGFTSVATSSSITVSSNRHSPFDFDGDSKTDISIFRPAPGEWWYLRSSDGQNRAFQFGSQSDKLVPADYTGDGKADVAIWRPSTGQWFILRSEDFSFFAFPFGASGDVPTPADYDGDGRADAAVFRPSTNTWYIQKSAGGTDIISFGTAGDKPVPADYDGDGKADIGIFRPNGINGAEWWIRRSSNGSVFATQFGASTDKAVQGDYTGDGKTDIAFWRPSNGNWFVLRSEDFSFYAFPFGTSGDAPVMGDYDGDGRFDAAVFRPSNTTWYANRSTAGILIQQFGLAGDLPVPNTFVP